MSFPVFYLKHLRRLRTPADVLEFAFRRNRHKRFLINAHHEGDDQPMASCEDRARRLVSFLQAAGRRPGNVVAYCALNAPDYFAVRAAAHLGGFIFFALPTNLATDVVIHFLLRSRAAAFFYRNPGTLDMDAVRAQTALPLLMDLDGPAYRDVFKHPAAGDRARLAPSAVSTLNLSSGTTGKTPKIVRITHENWVASLFGMIEGAGISRQHPPVFLCAMSYTAAGSTIFLPAMAAGMTVVVWRDNEPVEHLAATMEKHAVTYLYITPSRFLELFDWYRRNHRKPATLQHVVMGTERMPLPQFREALDYFGPIFRIGYGMVEVLPPLSLLRPEDYDPGPHRDPRVLGSVGRPAPGVRVKILDDRLQPLPTGHIGKIVVQSPTLAPGYFENEDLNKTYFRKDGFHSDDYGYLDQHGFLYILGRKQEMIGRDPALKFAVDLEDRLHALPFVARAAAVERNGRLLVAVTLRDPVSPDHARSTILNFCKEHGDPALIPDDIVVRNTLPLTFLGKLDRQRL